MSFDQAPIRRKLGVIVVVFAIPVAMLAWLFIQQSSKDIQFAQKERDGVTYLRAVWPVVNALVSAPNLAAQAHRQDVAMESAGASKDLTEALAALNWPNGEVQRNDKSEKAIAAARALLSKIADGSNLTLDPDLDSFYVMDANHQAAGSAGPRRERDCAGARAARADQAQR